MTGLEYLIDLHRREHRRAQAACDVVVVVMFAIGYAFYSLVF